MNPFNNLFHLRTKKLNLLHELSFLLKCRSHHVLPRFISNHFSFRSSGFFFNKCVTRFQFGLLRAAIKDTRTKLSKCELELYTLHLELSRSSHSAVWERADIITHSSAVSHSDMKLATLRKKFSNLFSKTIPSTNSNTDLINSPSTVSLPDTVVNKSSFPLSNDEVKLLSLGLNFAHNPYSIPLHNLLADLETGISRACPVPERNSLRYAILDNLNSIDTSLTDRSPSFLKPALHNLRNADVYVMRADKGGQIVVLDRDTYNDGLNALLADNNTYSPIKRNPLSSIIHNVKSTLKNCPSLPPKILDSLIPSNFNLAKIYALPKIHKPDMPFRPIISNSGTATLPTAKFVASKISFLSKFNKYTIQNSTEFVNKLKDITINPDDILVSFDVCSLFTNVPTTDAINCLTDKLLLYGHHNHLTPLECHDLISLSRMCLEQNYFLHNDQIYKQKFGLAMGSPLSPLLSDIFMDSIEDQIFKSPLPKPKFYIRYVDDNFTIWPHGLDLLYKFLDFINSIHPYIKFTMEIESNNSLPFLDVLVTKSDNQILTSVYRKPMAICSPPHVSSCHPWSQKISPFHTFVSRAINLSNTESALQAEIAYLKEIAHIRGYNPNIIDQAKRKILKKRRLSEITTLESQKSKPPTKFISIPFIPKISNKIGKSLKKFNIRPVYKPINKLSSIFNKHKTRTPLENSSGIYRIPCTDCEQIYIGQTRRAFKYRLAEHKGYVRRNELSNSALAEHVHETGHNINWKDAKIIQKCPNHQLNFFEGLHIQIDKCHNLNKKDTYFPSVWLDLLNS